MARWRECLEGGDARNRPRRNLRRKGRWPLASRCHKRKWRGWAAQSLRAGMLAHIGAQHDREYLLVSVVLPNAMIAPGFDNAGAHVERQERGGRAHCLGERRGDHDYAARRRREDHGEEERHRGTRERAVADARGAGRSAGENGDLRNVVEDICRRSDDGNSSFSGGGIFPDSRSGWIKGQSAIWRSWAWGFFCIRLCISGAEIIQFEWFEHGYVITKASRNNNLSKLSFWLNDVIPFAVKLGGRQSDLCEFGVADRDSGLVMVCVYGRSDISALIGCLGKIKLTQSLVAVSGQI